jgi:predicted RNase H-related nuclease YkuK (DUF458 family)
MSKILKGNFYNPSRGSLRTQQVIEEILAYMQSDPEKFYDVVVGCDSPSDESPDFPVAIVILKVGEGGRFFLKKVNYENRKFYSWRERVLEEVLLSCEAALYLKGELIDKIENSNQNYNYQFRYIHADIGGNGDTKEMVKEVVGLIRGNGFEPKIKPESYVASVVADRYT